MPKVTRPHPWAGKRIRLLSMQDDPAPIPPGTLGTITDVTPVHQGRVKWSQIHVQWDIERSLMLTVPPDEFEFVVELAEAIDAPPAAVPDEVVEFKRYLNEMLARAENTVSTENLRAAMWTRFLPEAVSFWTLAGVLERIADHIKEPSEDEEKEPDTDDC
jgi:hypothetical protein